MSGSDGSFALSSICPLCHGRDTALHEVAYQREYLKCGTCELVFLAPEFRLSPIEEQQRYLFHNNTPTDPGYRAHLAQALSPLLQVLKPGDSGLDFGCGPTPMASLLLQETGVTVGNYDPFFFPIKDALLEQYDFVSCIEVAEHFFKPGDEFELLHKMIRPRGWLLLATLLLEPTQSLKSWWYARDATHVSLYSKRSLSWIAKKFGWELMTSSDQVHLFRTRASREYPIVRRSLA